MLVLSLLYHVGRFGDRSWNDVIPGAIVATLLWWIVNSGFGFYVRHVPYSLVYGGLAAAIGLLVWMNLFALIVLLGAAYNAEALSRRR
jgi:membrane protein